MENGDEHIEESDYNAPLLKKARSIRILDGRLTGIEEKPKAVKLAVVVSN